MNRACVVVVMCLLLFGSALYQLPTDELIDWLADRCAPNDTVVEIGAGSGQIGMNLIGRLPSRTNFYCTDNYMQERPEIMLYYALFGQRAIRYPKFVEKYGALEAVDVHQPSIVFGAWVTKFGTADVAGHLDGVNYKTLFAANPCVKELILIGNTDTHKDYFQFEGINVEELKFPWLVSRADAGGASNWIKIKFDNTTGYNTSVSNMKVPSVQKCFYASGSPSVSNAFSIDIDNNPNIAVVGVGLNSITIRIWNLIIPNGAQFTFNGI
jgi:hypothetical protein